MKVAVFGAAGWLGRAILDNLEGRHDVPTFVWHFRGALHVHAYVNIARQT